MSDDLHLPEVPEPKPEDAEDVSWALSTAEAMWARGDHSEGIKWVRRAAEAASEAENDERALELAKAAADLAGLISRPPPGPASVDLEDVVVPAAAPPPVPPARGSLTPKAPAAKATPAKQAATPPAKPVAAPSRPPAPLPSQSATSASRTSAAPRPAAVSPSVPPPASSPASAEPSTARAQVPVARPSKPPPSVRGTGKRSSRKSRENLDSEARASRGVGDTSRNRAVDSDASVSSVAAPPSSAETLLGNNDPTVVGNLNDLLKDGDGGDRQTVVGAAPADLGATILSARLADKTSRVPSAFGTNGRFGSKAPVGTLLERTAPAGVPSVRASVAPPSRAPAEQHDPRIVTSQAVRVVVWRDANGIHVAPAGTVVSSITVDAVLVALEPNADLTAWLGGRDRT